MCNINFLYHLLWRPGSVIFLLGNNPSLFILLFYLKELFILRILIPYYDLRAPDNFQLEHKISGNKVRYFYSSSRNFP
jgi:hypothetical protein